MDGTKQERKKSIERSEKEELFVLQSGYVSSVGNPDRQTDFCKQSKRTQSRATVGCIRSGLLISPLHMDHARKKKNLFIGNRPFASLAQN